MDGVPRATRSDERMRHWPTVQRVRAALVSRMFAAVTPVMPPARLLRIAQIAPLAESVPPRLYGGTERVVAHLTDALVAAGHDVTLFASGEARTSARLAV